jgi:hypothetical protein|tara:strand:- start:1700 stop:2071 length:372 start_codon:yes stop_codon:yes gene_type:complete
MDLSEFTKKIEVLPEKVRYTDEVTGEDKEGNEICITWKHNYLPVSELQYYVRENHDNFESKINAREQEILEIWMKELKYDSKYYRVEDKIIKEIGEVTDQGQIETWKKPNPETHVPAEDTDIL